MDSFDHYSTALIETKWTGAGSGASISAGNGRNSTASMRCSTNGSGYSYIALANAAAWTVGFGFRTSSLTAGNGNNVPFWSLQDGYGNYQLHARYTAGGQIGIYRGGTDGGGGTLLGTTSGAGTLVNAFNFWEFGFLINGATGTVTVRQNGAVVLSLTGQNTQSTGNAQASVIQLGTSNNAGGTVNWDFDDLYVQSGSSLQASPFPGDQRIQAILPSGAGASTQFAVTGAATNWQAASDNPPDGDTSYVYSSTPGQIDLYTFGSLTPTSGTVNAVQTCLYARKDDAGLRTIQPEIRQGGVNYAVGSQHNIGTTYGYYLDMLTTDPTGAAWTIANVNGDQFGINEVA
jgi:hypothetical protein